MSYNLWFDFLKPELRSRNSYEIMDVSIDLDKTKENLVRDIFIHRIINHYHNKIWNIGEPRLIFPTLKNLDIRKQHK